MRTIGMKRALIGAAIAALAMNAPAAHAATATGTAKAKILRQITLSNTSDLQFATVISGATASTVAVSTAGGVTCGTGLTCTGTTTAANFDITGTNGAVVVVGGDANVTLNGSLGGTMNSTLRQLSGRRHAQRWRQPDGWRLQRHVQRHCQLPVNPDYQVGGSARLWACRPSKGVAGYQLRRPLFVCAAQDYVRGPRHG